MGCVVRVVKAWAVVSDSAPILIPLSELEASCGFPSPAQDYRTNEIDLNEVLFTNRQASFLMRARGHSMTRAGIFDGDELIVDRSIAPLDGHVVVAAVDGEMLVKRLRLPATGGVVLAAEHPDYPNLRLAELSELRVWGVVTRSLHRVSRD
ncbi:MAG: translesion error-prone DNA polymerase V autoproteolytic subunit [Leucobacter sp.]|nr:translesion error-prone DNA polymerase V autoproteolytic subunit [Leucobacter sp.]